MCDNVPRRTKAQCRKNVGNSRINSRVGKGDCTILSGVVLPIFKNTDKLIAVARFVEQQRFANYTVKFAFGERVSINQSQNASEACRFFYNKMNVFSVSLDAFCSKVSFRVSLIDDSLL